MLRYQWGGATSLAPIADARSPAPTYPPAQPWTPSPMRPCWARRSAPTGQLYSGCTFYCSAASDGCCSMVRLALNLSDLAFPHPFPSQVAPHQCRGSLASPPGPHLYAPMRRMQVVRSLARCMLAAASIP